MHGFYAIGVKFIARCASHAPGIATVIGVGFLATWTMVSNVTASVFIGIWKPFHLDDTVEILPET
jgi:hypothetical protein